MPSVIIVPLEDKTIRYFPGFSSFFVFSTMYFTNSKFSVGSPPDIEMVWYSFLFFLNNSNDLSISSLVIGLLYSLKRLVLIWQYLHSRLQSNVSKNRNKFGLIRLRSSISELFKIGSSVPVTKYPSLTSVCNMGLNSSRLVGNFLI